MPRLLLSRFNWSFTYSSRDQCFLQFSSFDVSCRIRKPETRPTCRKARSKKAVEEQSIIRFGACVLSEHRAYSFPVIPSKPQIFPKELAAVVAVNNPCLQRRPVRFCV